MPGNKVLIAGASGLVGHAAVEHFASLPGWEVIGVSRRVPRDLAGAELLSVDLLDADACAGTFGAMTDVTHLVYAALQEQSGLFQGWLDPELIARNGAMLRHLFEPLSAAASGLRHVSLLHGTKAYGIHRSEVDLASVHVPLRERESRVEHPNFYWVQEDYLRDKQASASWGLTTLRLTVIYGDAPGSNMNPIPVIGVYAALMRERGEPLHFPGPGSEPMLREAVDAELVARALAWAATTPEAYGHAFNLTNGDVFVWEHVWPAIAESLGMEAGRAASNLAGRSVAQGAGGLGVDRGAIRSRCAVGPGGVRRRQFAGLRGHGVDRPASGAGPVPQQHDRGAAGRLRRVHRHRGHVPQVVPAVAGEAAAPARWIGPASNRRAMAVPVDVAIDAPRASLAGAGPLWEERGPSGPNNLVILVVDFLPEDSVSAAAGFVEDFESVCCLPEHEGESDG